MLHGIASVDVGGEVFHGDGAAAVAIDEDGQVDHFMENASHASAEPEVSEFWETVAQSCKWVSDAVVEF